MGFTHGEVRQQNALFPVSLEEMAPSDHACRVIDAFPLSCTCRGQPWALARQCRAHTDTYRGPAGQTLVRKQWMTTATVVWNLKRAMKLLGKAELGPRLAAV